LVGFEKDAEFLGKSIWGSMGQYDPCDRVAAGNGEVLWTWEDVHRSGRAHSDARRTGRDSAPLLALKQAGADVAAIKKH
jgi:hypothetical protein